MCRRRWNRCCCGCWWKVTNWSTTSRSTRLRTLYPRWFRWWPSGWSYWWCRQSSGCRCSFRCNGCSWLRLGCLWRIPRLGRLLITTNFGALWSSPFPNLTNWRYRMLCWPKRWNPRRRLRRLLGTFWLWPLLRPRGN